MCIIVHCNCFRINSSALNLLKFGTEEEAAAALVNPTLRKFSTMTVLTWSGIGTCTVTSWGLKTHSQVHKFSQMMCTSFGTCLSIVCLKTISLRPTNLCSEPTSNKNKGSGSVAMAQSVDDGIQSSCPPLGPNITSGDRMRLV